MKLYHSSGIPEKTINDPTFKFDINFSGTQKNGDNQAAGIHFSSDEMFAKNYYSTIGSFIEAEININNFEDFYGLADPFLYQEILEEFIGSEKIIELSNQIEDNVRDDAEEYFDVYDRIVDALIFYDQDIIETIERNYSLDKNMKKELQDILSHSFELIDDISHENCYNMLAATVGGRVKASELLIDKGINGFSYKLPHEDAGEVQNYCVLNTNLIKNINVIPQQKESIKYR